MRNIRYNLYLELLNKRLLTEEELGVVGDILGNIDIDIDSRYKLNSFITEHDNELTITKYGNINGLESGRLEIVATDKSVTIKLSGYVDHLREEIIYTYSKNAFGLFEDKHYESLFYRFETNEGEYILSAFPSRKTRNIEVASEFYNRYSQSYMKPHRASSYLREGILPTSKYMISAKNVATLARGAVTGDLRKFIIEKHTKPYPDDYSKKPYQKRK